MLDLELDIEDFTLSIQLVKEYFHDTIVQEELSSLARI